MSKLPIKSWQQRVYIAKKIGVNIVNGNQTVEYASPVAYNLNVQPLSDDARIEMFGANSKKMYKAFILDRNVDIDEFDRAYLDGATFVGETVNGFKSNYIVRRVARQNIACMIFFESIKG